jgi:hypothetical protein
MYQSSEDKKVFIKYAHNDWVQLLAEGGIVGLFLVIGSIIFFLYTYIQIFRNRSDPLAVYLGIGSLCGLFAIMLHSFVAFDLHIPAIPLSLSAILAIGYIGLHLKRRRPRDKFLYNYLKKHETMKYYSFLIITAVLISLTGWWSIKHFMGEIYCNTVPNSTLNRDQSPPLEEIDRAISWDEGNAIYWWKRALELIRLRNSEWNIKEVEKGGGTQMEIIATLERAVQLNPFNPEYHLRLGWEYTYLWRSPEYHNKWLPAADMAMDRAAYFAGEKNPNLHVELGNYWVMRSKTLYYSIPARESAWAKACWHYKKAQEIENSKALKEKIAKYVRMFYPDDEIVQQVMLKN